MKSRSLRAPMVPALALAAAAATPALAQMQRLDDRQLEQVQARSVLDAQTLAGNLVPGWQFLVNAPQQPVTFTPDLPRDFQVDATQWLSAFGLHYNGPSFGTFEVRGLDTSGLVITLQGH